MSGGEPTRCSDRTVRADEIQVGDCLFPGDYGVDRVQQVGAFVYVDWTRADGEPVRRSYAARMHTTVWRPVG